jgi:hypothetical protein
MEAVVLTAPHAFEIREVPRPEPGVKQSPLLFDLFGDAWATFTERRDGVIRVMLDS